jgi:hypothetical protein
MIDLVEMRAEDGGGMKTEADPGKMRENSKNLEAAAEAIAKGQITQAIMVVHDHLAAVDTDY